MAPRKALVGTLCGGHVTVATVMVEGRRRAAASINPWKYGNERPSTCTVTNDRTVITVTVGHCQ